ncbi:MAG: hypothetical protein ACF8GE_04045 [Phycisphaerales bacterium JB043]
MRRVVLSAIAVVVLIALAVVPQRAMRAQGSPETPSLSAHGAAGLLGISAETLLLCGVSPSQAADIRDTLVSSGPLRDQVALRLSELDVANRALTDFLETTPSSLRHSDEAQATHEALLASVDGARTSLNNAKAILQATALSGLAESQRSDFEAFTQDATLGLSAPYRALGLDETDRKRLARALRHEQADQLDALRYSPETWAAMEPTLSSEDQQWLSDLRDRVAYTDTVASVEQDLDAIEAELSF